MNAADARPSDDPVVGAFDAVTSVAEQTARNSRQLAKESRSASKERAAGASVSSSMAGSRPQRILRLTGHMAKELVGTSSSLRKTLVHQSRQEGAGTSAIARAFGVSHQRISTLLRKTRETPER